MRSVWFVGFGLWTIATVAEADVLSFQQPEYAAIESAATGSLLVVRTGALSGTVSVGYATAHGTAGSSDYTPKSGTLIFGPGVASQPISIALTNDAAAEGHETVRVALRYPSGAQLGFPSVAMLQIQDDDAPAVFLSKAGYVTIESATILCVDVRRSGPLTSPASVRVTTQNGTAAAPWDIAALDADAKFAEGSAVATVPITIKDDALAEGVEAFHIVLTAPAGAALGTQRQAVVTITDSDPPIVPALPVALGEYHGWFGLLSHSPGFFGADWEPHPRPYDSRDLNVMRRHIVNAKIKGLNGFLYNWYGSTCALPNDTEDDCRIMDENLAALIQLAESEHPDFKIALLYDEGAVAKGRSKDPSTFTARIREDLAYAHARGYLTSSVALQLNGRPAVFVFPYDDVDPFIDWAAVRQGVAAAITLLERDPTSTIPHHDEQFDGHYPWVRPSGDWSTNGHDWGREYLEWFYRTMALPPYANRIAAGGIWPGFDDSLAPWGQGRYIARHTQDDTRVLHETRQLAAAEGMWLTIWETWNDVEEGSDIEYTDLDAPTDNMVVNMELPDPEILVRSTPLQVTWNASRGNLELQLYKDSAIFYRQTHSPGVFLKLVPYCAYEVKIWIGDRFIEKTIKVRRQDPIPGVVPVDVPDAVCRAVS